MNAKQLAFVGIGTEQGQSKTGLADSPFFALEIIKSRWPLIDSQSYIDDSHGTKINRTEDLNKLNWPYFQRVYSAIQKNLVHGHQVINWGGDHGVALSTVAAFTAVHHNGYVLWIDAHGDLNTPESSLSGNFHGMPISILLGIGNKPHSNALPFWGKLSPNKLIYFGLRDLDPFERQLIKSLGITAYFCDEMNPSTYHRILAELCSKLGNHPLHVSFDIDSIDPVYAPSTGVKVSGGLSPQQIYLLAKKLCHLKSVKSVDVVEINPKIGTFYEVGKTFSIAINFLEQLFVLHQEVYYDSTTQSAKGILQHTQPRYPSFWP